MQIEVTRLDGALQHIRLVGRMDVDGAQAIDLQLTALTATHDGSVILDLSGVELLASIGIRTLIQNAKALRRRGGHMVLLGPRGMVATVLTTTGIDTLIPIVADLDAARRALAAAQGA